jgi:hypothetical protein
MFYLGIFFLVFVYRVVSFLKSISIKNINMLMPEGKRPLGRPRRRWLDNIREVGWDGMDWIDLAQDRDPWRAVVNTVMNLRVP